MRLTVLGHSALYVESGDATLLVDPWLTGSCYWRSWWHFPPVPPPVPAVLAPDYLYLTHHHFDHFHYPTLRRLDRRTHVLALAEEVDGGVSYERFADYFTSFLRSLPALPLRLLFRRSVAFDMPEAGHKRYWVLDFRRRVVWRSSRLPDEHGTLIRVPEGVLADAIEKRIVHLVHVSMRLRVRLRRGGTREDFAFWGLLALFELGYLPLRKSLTPRAASVLWARRAELLDMAGNLTRRGGFAQRLSGNYAARGTQTAS
jgi:Beta-lactamase superfamily domain